MNIFRCIFMFCKVVFNHISLFILQDLEQYWIFEEESDEDNEEVEEGGLVKLYLGALKDVLGQVEASKLKQLKLN